MDFCRNMTVSGEYHKQQEQAPPASTLDDLFSAQDTEVDVSLEWLSVFVEDCLSSTGNCLPLPNQNLHQTSNNQATTTPPPTIKPTFQQQQQKTQQNPSSPPFEKFPVPGKARRSKRNRVITTNAKTRRLNPLLTSWSYNSHLNLPPSDPPLLHQTHWLADSELIISPKKQELGIKFVTRFEDDQEINAAGLGLMSSSYVNGNDKDKDKGSTGLQQQQQQQPRRCTHCLSQRTPQWRAGPLGPKTLCNACGVRYKSGRLLPEYRPAKSPTFSTNLHSNSHKKVLEMRNMVSSTSTTTTTTTTSPTPSTSIPLIPSHN